MRSEPTESSTCWCASGARLVPFYEACDVPLATGPPAATREAALAVRRGAVSLALCPTCGLVSNKARDGAVTAAANEVLADERLTPDPREGTLRAERPDVLYTLREGAFWELAGPRRRYFSPGSLARLVRAAGFDVTDLRRAHDDRHFLLAARFCGRPSAMRFNLEDDLAALTDAADGFAAAAHRQASRWRRIIDEFLGERKRVVVWGAGTESVGFLSALGITDAQVAWAVDPAAQAADSFLLGTGQRIVAPQALHELPPGLVIVTDSRQRDDARRAMTAAGVRPELLSL